MEAVLNIVSYLQAKHNSRLSLYKTYPEIANVSFKMHKWVDFYGNVKEVIPPNMPETRGKDVDFRIYVDSYHAGDKSTSRSRTGLLIYTNMALIQWLSNKKLTIEA